MREPLDDGPDARSIVAICLTAIAVMLFVAFIASTIAEAQTPTGVRVPVRSVGQLEPPGLRTSGFGEGPDSAHGSMRESSKARSAARQTAATTPGDELLGLGSAVFELPGVTSSRAPMSARVQRSKKPQAPRRTAHEPADAPGRSASFPAGASTPAGGPKRADMIAVRGGGNGVVAPDRRSTSGGDHVLVGIARGGGDQRGRYRLAAVGVEQGHRPGGLEALTLARACFVESGFRARDCTAIAYVIARRTARVRGRFVDVLVRYSALDARTPRAAQARRYPDGDVPGYDARWNRQWAELRALARRFVAGELPSPCGATHWGSRTIPVDVRRAARAVEAGRWRAVPCGDTLNAYYAEVGLR